jgi:YspA, cpYpsA-related SLOG family
VAKRFKTIGAPAETVGARILITGDRGWNSTEKVYDTLVHALNAFGPNIIVVEGEANGADKIARTCAEQLGLTVEGWPADWENNGLAAGPIRNQFMLDESRRRAFSDGYQLRCGVAFHANIDRSKGTKDMVQRLEKAGVPVLRIR